MQHMYPVFDWRKGSQNSVEAIIFDMYYKKCEVPNLTKLEIMLTIIIDINTLV